MTKDNIILINEKFNDAINQVKDNNENDKVKNFKSTIDTIHSYSEIMRKMEPELLETIDLEFEDQQIIEHYKEIAKFND